MEFKKIWVSKFKINTECAFLLLSPIWYYFLLCSTSPLFLIPPYCLLNAIENCKSSGSSEEGRSSPSGASRCCSEIVTRRGSLTLVDPLCDDQSLSMQEKSCLLRMKPEKKDALTCYRNPWKRLSSHKKTSFLL